MRDYLQILTINYSTFIILNLLLSSIVILLERKNPTGALAWLFFLNLLPGIGFFFYILLAQNVSKRKIFRYTKEESLLYTTVLNKQSEAIKLNRFNYVHEGLAHYKDMILFHNRLSHSLLTQNNSVIIYTNGFDKFADLEKDIVAARHHIHLLYYIVKNDSLSEKIFTLLKEKASSGVEVRFLIDHVGGRTLKRKQIQDLRNHGIQVAFFFPSKFKYLNLKGNYRNHRKIVIIDGSIGYIGGLNIGNEYLGLDKRFGYWRDTHLRLTGDSVNSLQLRFILDWRNASGEYLNTSEDYIKSETTPFTTPIQIVDSGPDNINEQIKQGYLQIIHKAKKYLYIQTPYFIPDESIIEGLKIAAASGVDVRIMIPNKPDHPLVYWATTSYCGDLLPYGVKIYTYENGFLHAKTIVSDDAICSVGSCNFDIRSFKLNFEVNAFIYNDVESIKLRLAFEDDIKYSNEITLKRYKKRSLFIKGKESICRLFSPVL